MPQQAWDLTQGLGIGLGFAVLFLLLMLPFLKFILNIFAKKLADNIEKSNEHFKLFISKVGECGEHLKNIADNTKTIAEKKNE